MFFSDVGMTVDREDARGRSTSGCKDIIQLVNDHDTLSEAAPSA